MGKVMDKAEIKQLAKGADLVGVAPADTLNEKAPLGYRPEDVLKGCKSVIVVAIRRSYPVIDGLPETRGIYTQEQMMINGKLNSIIWDLALKLDDRGFRSIYVPSAAPYGDFFQLMGIISHKHAAIEAGLGTWSVSQLVLTPKYGSRVRFASCLTEAKIEPDKKLTTNLCKEAQSYCNFACINGCPVEGVLTYDPKTGEGKIDKQKCSRHQEVVLIPPAREWSSLRCGLCVKNCPVGQ